jgi:tight adherence protein C
MTMLFNFMLGLTLFCGLAALASMLVTRTSRSAADRLFAVTLGSTQKRARQNTQDVQKKILAAIRTLGGRLGMVEDERIAARFVRAGIKSGTGRDLYFAGRLVGPVVALLVGSLIPVHRVFAMVALAGTAYLAPDVLLTRMVKRRREKIRLSVPDAVDLLVICVDAGLGLDQAMLRVGAELLNSHPTIYEELMQINREQRAGKLRLEAWQAMAERSQLPEVDGFVNMLAQTERFGTPIARALSNFADGIRLKRRQRAEELAAKTTVKIIFPLVFFIFPSMFIVLLGPAAINIMRGLAAQ